MIVFIVCRGIAYEGFNEPEAVFASRESAEKYIEEVKSSRTWDDRYEYIETFELVVN
jgi:hypothetical protein